MRSQGISQFYLHTPHSSTNGMNHMSFPSQPILIYWPWGMEGWVGLGGWLHTDTSVRHLEL